MSVTGQQLEYLALIEDAPGLTARQIAAVMDKRIARGWYRYSYDQAHGILCRLEQRGLLRRAKASGGATWFITPKGKEARTQ